MYNIDDKNLYLQCSALIIKILRFKPAFKGSTTSGRDLKQILLMLTFTRRKSPAGYFRNTELVIILRRYKLA